jgi:hypothetical protein
MTTNAMTDANSKAPVLLDAKRDANGRFEVGHHYAVGRPVGSVNKFTQVAKNIIEAHSIKHLETALNWTAEHYPHLYVKFILQYARPYRAEINVDEERDEFAAMPRDAVLDILARNIGDNPPTAVRFIESLFGLLPARWRAACLKTLRAIAARA